jgi:hypothetical protein
MYSWFHEIFHSCLELAAMSSFLPHDDLDSVPESLAYLFERNMLLAFLTEPVLHRFSWYLHK